MSKYAQELKSTTQAMMAEGKDILVMDESNQKVRVGLDGWRALP